MLEARQNDNQRDDNSNLNLEIRSVGVKYERVMYSVPCRKKINLGQFK